MKDVVDSQIINHRSKILCDLDKQSGYNFRNQFIGKKETILIENISSCVTSDAYSGKTQYAIRNTQYDIRISGRSERYFMVNIDHEDTSSNRQFQKNDMVKVTLLKNTKDGMTARPLNEN